MDDFTENEKLHQLNTMVLTDIRITGLLPAYLFTETPDNQDSVLLKAQGLLLNHRVKALYLINNLGGSEPGYPGFEAWRQQLNRIGVEDKKVNSIAFHEPMLHTLSEAFEAVKFLKVKVLDKILIIAPPFHQLRCFLSMVTAINKLNPRNLRVFNQVGRTQPWDEHVVHSQKTTQGKRKDLIIGEYRRILKYQKEGTPVPLCSADEALAYLEWRDS